MTLPWLYRTAAAARRAIRFSCMGTVATGNTLWWIVAGRGIGSGGMRAYREAGANAAATEQG